MKWFFSIDNYITDYYYFIKVTAKPVDSKQLVGRTQTSKLSQTNPSLPPTATRPNNQPLIAANGHEAKQPNPHCRQRPQGQTTKPCSHHVAIMQPSTNQHLIAANAMRPNKPTLHRQRHANKPSQRPLIDATPISRPKNPSTAANGTPIKSFGTRQIELQLGLQDIPGVSSLPTSCSLNHHK